MSWTAFIDGGSRGNPGPAAAGVRILDPSGKVAFEGGFFLGKATNNHAEYRGLLAALDLLERAGAEEAAIVSDSELLVRQINGQYKVKSPELRPLFEDALKRLRKLDGWQVRHVLRNENTHADRMANKAMDARGDVVALDRLNLMEREDGSPAEPAPPSSRGATGPQATFQTLERPAPAAGSIELRVIRGPSAGACPAGMRKEQSFLFGATVPAGVCVNACASAIEAVRGMIEVGADAAAAPLTISCDHPGCQAVFEVRVWRR